MNMRGILLKLLTASATFLAGISLASDNSKAYYVDNGLLHSASGEEVALFGVNYNAPFAFTYRAIGRVGADHEAAITMDVSHLKRLGVDAYRVHLWDRELSDKQGNLLDNEHLRLMDFLVAELKKNDIKVIITAIGWWGTGYPEPDPKETGFSADYSKPEMNQKQAAIAAQKRYIKQLLNHKNRYTGVTYKADPDVVAIELFNEPKHHGSPAESAAYVEELVEVVRGTGLKKPIFYNISEQGNKQKFAEAVCDTFIDGIGYQWYPTGIVRFSATQGNMLPTVQRYTDVFAGTGSCDKKARMVYEFDASDITGSVMYPAMARSFREAGFQWATMFSYDPAVTAHTNAEYNTHYLNLLYTPNKAISFLIAGEVFRTMPLRHTTAPYPDNNRFLDVTLDYHQDLSVLNNRTKFYYSNNTATRPEDARALQHIAGVGSSPVVDYDGSGAYFLDKLKDNVWQLEIYPDLQRLQDPHPNSSLRREVGRLYSNERQFTLRLPDLGKNFHIQKADGSGARLRAQDGRFSVRPGIYVLSRKRADVATIYGGDTPRFVLPDMQQPTAVSVWHQPLRSVDLDGDMKISAQIGSTGTPDAVDLLARYKGSHWFATIPMQQGDGGWYHGDLAEAERIDRPGPLEYALVVTHDGTRTTFPGGAQGSPRDWDFLKARDYWATTLKPAGSPVTLFDAEKDSNNVLFPQDGRPQPVYVVTGADHIALRLKPSNLQENGHYPLARLTLAKDAALSHRNLEQYDTVTLQIRSLGEKETITFGVLDEHGLAYNSDLEVDDQWQRLSIPLASLTSGTTILPQAYPIFMPFKLNAEEREPWPENADLSRIQGLQFWLSNLDDQADEKAESQHGIEIVDVKLVQAAN
jgi:hypothetical protein